MRAELPLTSLLLDIQNPRIEIQNSHRDAVREVFRAEPKKMQRLAEDIVQQGMLNPLEKIGVSESPEHKGRYVVHEGNRRVAALLALNNPTLIDGAVSESMMKALRKLSTRFLQSNPADEIECEILPAEQLEHWITLRHTGANEGAGVVGWGTLEQGRYLERKGAARPLELQFVDRYLQLTAGDQDEAALAKEIAATSIRRLLESKPFREQMGLRVQDGWLHSDYDPDQTFRWMRKVVHDFSGGKKSKKKVADIYSSKEIEKYLEEFAEHELPDPEKALKQPVPIQPVSKAQPSVPASGRPKKKALRWSLRGAKIQPQHSRLQDIIHEIERLSYENANIHAVMARVFLELSVDDAIRRHKVQVKPERNNKITLKTKVLSAVKFAEEKTWIDKKQANAMRQVIGGALLGSTQSLNEIVHNQDLHPSPADVETLWKNLASFLIALHTH